MDINEKDVWLQAYITALSVVEEVSLEDCERVANEATDAFNRRFKPADDPADEEPGVV